MVRERIAGRMPSLYSLWQYSTTKKTKIHPWTVESCGRRDYFLDVHDRVPLRFGGGDLVLICRSRYQFRAELQSMRRIRSEKVSLGFGLYRLRRRQSGDRDDLRIP